MRQILVFGYEHFLVPENVDVGNAVDIFSRMVKVNQEGYGKDALYIPEEDEGLSIQILCVHNDQVRQLTIEESKAKERKSLENRVDYLERQLKEEQEKNKELECVNKALCEDKSDDNRELNPTENNAG